MSCLHKLYTVRLTDLGTYTATVAAYSEDEAVRILQLSDTDTLYIRAGTNDLILADDHFVRGADTMLGGTTYGTYTADGATLLLEHGLTFFNGSEVV